jgi:hypothetical protein
MKNIKIIGLKEMKLKFKYFQLWNDYIKTINTQSKGNFTIEASHASESISNGFKFITTCYA